MTELLEKAIAKLQRLPDDRQDEAAELILSVIEQDQETVQLAPRQVAEVERRLKAPAEYTTHADVRSFFNRRAG